MLSKDEENEIIKRLSCEIVKKAENDLKESLGYDLLKDKLECLQKWAMVALGAVVAISFVGGSVMGYETVSFIEKAGKHEKEFNDAVKNEMSAVNNSAAAALKSMDEIKAHLENSKKDIFALEDEVKRQKDKIALELDEATQEVRAKSQALQAKLSETEKQVDSDVSKLKEDGEKQIQDAVKLLEDNAKPEFGAAISAVKGSSEQSVEEIKQKGKDAAGEIETAKTEALTKLGVETLPDLKTVHEQIKALEASGGKVNIWNIRTFISDSIMALLITLPVLSGLLGCGFCRLLSGRKS